MYLLIYEPADKVLLGFWLDINVTMLIRTIIIKIKKNDDFFLARFKIIMLLTHCNYDINISKNMKTKDSKLYYILCYDLFYLNIIIMFFVLFCFKKCVKFNNEIINKNLTIKIRL
jgi:hypothetical protein